MSTINLCFVLYTLMKISLWTAHAMILQLLYITVCANMSFAKVWSCLGCFWNTIFISAHLKMCEFVPEGGIPHPAALHATVFFELVCKPHPVLFIGGCMMFNISVKSTPKVCAFRPCARDCSPHCSSCHWMLEKLCESLNIIEELVKPTFCVVVWCSLGTPITQQN